MAVDPLTTTLVAAAATPVFKLLIKEVWDLGKDAGIESMKKWKVAKAFDKLYTRIAEVRNVKTLWQIDRAVDLTNFYYPAKIIEGDNMKAQLSSVEQLPRRVVLRGTVGQGKSILMRYLTCRCLQEGKRIPLFLELRRLNDGRPISSHLQDTLAYLGFPDDTKTMELILKSGKCVLILDGYDEITPENDASAFNAIEDLLRRNSDLSCVISSRSNTNIYTSNLFQTVELARLDSRDVNSIIQKLMLDTGDCSALLDDLKKAPEKMFTLLDTPLMVTLLLIAYRRSPKLPETYSDFYENLFITLLSRHDDSKPGGVPRPRRSKLQDSKIERVFDALSFQGRTEGRIDFSRNEIIPMVSYNQKLWMTN